MAEPSSGRKSDISNNSITLYSSTPNNHHSNNNSNNNNNNNSSFLGSLTPTPPSPIPLHFNNSTAFTHNLNNQNVNNLKDSLSNNSSSIKSNPGSGPFPFNFRTPLAEINQNLKHNNTNNNFYDNITKKSNNSNNIHLHNNSILPLDVSDQDIIQSSHSSTGGSTHIHNNNNNLSSTTLNDSNIRVDKGAEIILNVGGYMYSTTLSTLHNVPDSYFTSRFSKTFNEQPTNGYFFIDRDGGSFRFILNFLRDSDLPHIQFTNDIQHLAQLLIEAKFYQVSTLIDLLEARIEYLENERRRERDIENRHRERLAASLEIRFSSPHHRQPSSPVRERYSAAALNVARNLGGHNHSHGIMPSQSIPLIHHSNRFEPELPMAMNSNHGTIANPHPVHQEPTPFVFSTDASF